MIPWQADEQGGRFLPARRDPWIAMPVGRRKALRLPTNGVSTMAERLSPRESIIARHVACGEAHKVIALTYSLSIQAVSTYLKRAKAKLGVHSQAELVRALATPTAGPQPSDQVAEAFSDVTSTRGTRPADLLTRAQSNVLVGVLHGQRHAEIASSLGITKRTVAAHVSAILHKFAVSSRAELIAAVLAVPEPLPTALEPAKPRR